MCIWKEKEGESEGGEEGKRDGKGEKDREDERKKREKETQNCLIFQKKVRKCMRVWKILVKYPKNM